MSPPFLERRFKQAPAHLWLEQLSSRGVSILYRQLFYGDVPERPRTQRLEAPIGRKRSTQKEGYVDMFFMLQPLFPLGWRWENPL